MFQRLQNSWELVKASLRVLAADKELLVFPIASSIALMLVSAVFILPLIAGGLFDSMFFSEDGFPIFGYVIGFLFYFVQYFVIIFANSALIGAASIRLSGGDPSVMDGLRMASQRVLNIAGWAAIAATVGMILKSLAERNNGLGRFVISLIGLAWNLATYLVVPVLVIEGVNPIEAIKRSVSLLKQTWGEQIVGNIGIGAISGLATFLLFLIFIPLVIMLVIGEFYVAAIAVGIFFVITLGLVNLITGALNGIYIAAVYQFASNGQTSGYFDPALVQNAFRRG